MRDYPWLAKWTFVMSLVFISALLAWQWLHGGIAAHHLAADPTNPAISNVWGLVIVPLFGFFSTRQLSKAPQDGWSLPFSLVVGLLLAALFSVGLTDGILWLLGLLLLSALWLPWYQPTYVLGLCCGFSLAIGPVLPLIPAAFLALVAGGAAMGRRFWRGYRAT